MWLCLCTYTCACLYAHIYSMCVRFIAHTWVLGLGGDLASTAHNARVYVARHPLTHPELEPASEAPTYTRSRLLPCTAANRSLRWRRSSPLAVFFSKSSNKLRNFRRVFAKSASFFFFSSFSTTLKEGRRSNQNKAAAGCLQMSVDQYEPLRCVCVCCVGSLP